MSLKTKVTIQSKTVTYDGEGIPSETWANVQSLEGTMLPFGNKLALQEYGYTQDVKYRFFYKGSNANLVVGNRLVYGSLELPIVYVADYKKAMDVLLNTSNEN
jgi:hypothetical protein